MTGVKFSNITKEIIKECQDVITSVNEDNCVLLVEEILKADKVFFIGVGRVFLSLKAISKRFNHLGISSHCVGDISEPAITKNDLLIVASGSGETLIPVAISKKAKDIGARIVYIGTNKSSTVGKISDFHIVIPVNSKIITENYIISKQPMSTLFEQSLLLLGDAISLYIIRIKNINISDLWNYPANLE